MRTIATELEAREYLDGLGARAEELFGAYVCSMPYFVRNAEDFGSFRLEGPGVNIGVAVQQEEGRRVLVPWVRFEVGSAELLDVGICEVGLCCEESVPAPTLTVGANALDSLIERAVRVREAFSANAREIRRHVVELGGPLSSDSPATSSDPDHIPF